MIPSPSNQNSKPLPRELRPASPVPRAALRFAAILLTAICSTVFAQVPEEARLPATEADRRAVLAQAVKDFETAAALKSHASADARNLYDAARAGFQSLVYSGIENGRLYYNLANAQLRLGDIGRAIANYRRALRLIPGDVQARKNLEFARKLCEFRFRKPASSAMVETLFFWHFSTSVAARTRAALIGYAFFWLLALGARLLPRRIPSLTWLMVAVAAFTLVVGTSATWDILHSDSRAGVLVADDVMLRKGNGIYYEPQLEQALPQGVEFELINTRKDVDGKNWYHVRLPDGKDGWLPADQAELI